MRVVQRGEQGFRGRRRGLSLTEVMFVVAILSMVMGAVGMVGQTTDRAYRAGVLKASLEQQVAVTIENVLGDLRISVADSLDPALPPGASTNRIQYVQAIGMQAGQVVTTPVRELRFEYETGELDDGLDNNGNGLVDEGRIVLIEDIDGAEPRRRVLTRWVRELEEGEEPNGLDDDGDGQVDEAGFALERQGKSLTLRLTLEKPAHQGGLVARTAQTSIRLRN